MTAEVRPDPLTCQICGAIASGSFCASCGHELARPKLSWIERLPVIGNAVGFIATIGRIARRPLSEPVRLAITPAYRKHIGLLVSALAVWGALAYFISLAAPSVNQTGNQPGGMAAPTDILFFLDLAVAGLLSYALFRALAPDEVRFDTHVKLWMVLAAFYLVAHVFVVVSASALILVMQESRPDQAGALFAAVPVLSMWIIRAVHLTMVCHYAAAFGRLWSMPFWQAALLLVMAWGLAIYPSAWLHYGLGFCYGVVAGGIQEITTGGTTAGGQL